MQDIHLIDTHAHLDYPEYDADRDDCIKRAQDSGVKTIIAVGCWDKDRGFGGSIELAKKYPNVYASIGVHPHEAKDARDDAIFDLMRVLIEEEKALVVAVGETGLDYHYTLSPRDIQKRVFVRELALARELNLPVIIHSRDAGPDMFEILKSEGAVEAGGVFHCFSGAYEDAKKAIDMGFYISFTGILTFPKAASVREAVKKIPIENMMLETDCPFLSPVPERGKRNEPAFLVNTARAIAEIKGLSVNDVARITTRNAFDLFGIGRGKEAPKIAYAIRNSLYLNVTNRCTNRCTFCAKFKSYTVKGHYLRLNEEPELADVLSAVGPEPEKYDEIVFCGFGEPLLRLDLVRQAGLHLKKRGCCIRIDTDGLANLVHRRNVLPELRFVDVLSVSLNAPDSGAYQRLVKTPFGDAAYPAILYFLREAKKYVSKVVASVVAVPGLDIEACRRVAEDDLGVAFRVRQYDNVG
ncbi:MAG: TatD family hydrolase [Deltaproteobacteria bacterium]